MASWSGHVPSRTCHPTIGDKTSISERTRPKERVTRYLCQPLKMGPMIEKRSNLIQKNDEILCHPTIMVLGTDYPNYQSTGDLLSAIAINNLIWNCYAAILGVWNRHISQRMYSLEFKNWIFFPCLPLSGSSNQRTLIPLQNWTMTQPPPHSTKIVKNPAGNGCR